MSEPAVVLRGLAEILGTFTEERNRVPSAGKGTERAPVSAEGPGWGAAKQTAVGPCVCGKIEQDVKGHRTRGWWGEGPKVSDV